ncbi:hemerythrin domain-containing protein [Roseateles koreensis]|uniref:Hemerythrin domain-containing protein n=1 Tax=Roseateles koreensis TaxID=2987526 RepID=A0ABT5KXZ4_9BURK|nr:hemerythrin domain-containing protein [Roseateles koreensis]MDC8787223.1 hemerythrin domain-containing protein [Roseateles koreensis]
MRIESAQATPLALKIIRDEHSALAAMLRSIPLLLAEQRRHQTLPDFAALRAMLFYVDEFPERLHHPKESLLLFPKLRARAPEIRGVLDRLDEDHRRGEHAVRELEHALLAFEMMGEARRDAFETQARHYVKCYLQHMETEEREILPLALQMLSPADWAEMDEAFAANQDPLSGHAPHEDYAALVQKILAALPSPLGLGPSLS